MTGWVKVWRRLEHSDVWELPPLTTRIWIWILIHACHEPRTVYGVQLEPGELFTSYRSIAEAVRWRQNGAWVVPSSKSIRWALETLSSRQALQHGPRQHGTWVKVLHWEDYQGNTEDDQGSTNGSTHNTSTAGPRQDHGTKQELKKERSKKKESLAYTPEFEEFWKVYPRKVKKPDAMRAWANALEDFTAESICTGLHRQLAALLSSEAQYIPHPTTWLNGQRWLDETTDNDAELDLILEKNRNPRRVR